MLQESSFVFNLFLKHRLHPFYSNPIRNKVTDTLLPLLPLIDVQKKNPSYFMVTDIPDYLEVHLGEAAKNLKMKSVAQYKGFLCDLSKYDAFLDYMTEIFSKKTIKNINAKKRQLETAYPISYKFHYGELDKSHYDFLMNSFYELLRKRFDEKKTYNRYLLHWKNYHEMAYPMILAKKASLYVIYNGGEPIAMALDFYLDTIAFGYIQVFDPGFSKYYMGDICMVKRLEWLMENQFKVFDFLMGTTYYKAKWSNVEYFYHHHLFYRPSSILAFAKLGFMVAKLRSMQYLRDVGILGKIFSMDRYLYRKMSKKMVGFDWRNP